MAKFSKNDPSLSSPFLNVLKEEIIAHKQSASAIDRAKALVQYNFNPDTYNSFLGSLEDD